MSFNSVCNHTRTPAARSSDFVITRMITYRIGLHSFLLPLLTELCAIIMVGYNTLKSHGTAYLACAADVSKEARKGTKLRVKNKEQGEGTPSPFSVTPPPLPPIWLTPGPLVRSFDLSIWKRKGNDCCQVVSYCDR